MWTICYGARHDYLNPHRCIDEILTARDQNCQRATMMLDRYFVLNSDEAREEYVAAIIHRLLVEHNRCRERIF